MAERAANREGVATRLFSFARAVVLLAVIAIGVPAVLLWAARERFGSGSPFGGVATPSDWTVDAVRSSLTERLTDQTIADVVIRLSLVVAWVAVVVLVLTVVAEVVHMLRHGGLAMPAVRGLGPSQRAARVIASGLLAIVPLLGAPSGALADGTASLTPDRSAATSAVPFSEVTYARGSTPRDDAPLGFAAPGETSTEAPSTAIRANARYVVQPGDSVFGIAERVAGPDSADVAAFAERLVDVNLGRQMPDGRYFNNAAFIDVGWVLELPGLPDAGPAQRAVADEPAAVHVVEHGESLWSIADDELGDPLRWPEVFEANEGRVFDDGATLRDPDVIQPGWEIAVPVDPQIVDEPLAATVDDATVDDAPLELLAEVGPEAPSASGAGSRTRHLDSIDPDADANIDAAFDAADLPAARRDNVWDAPGGSPVSDVGAGDASPDRVADEAADHAADHAADTAGPTADHDDVSNTAAASPALLTFGGAAMLSTGVLALLAVRRRNQLRRSLPRTTVPRPAGRPAATERSLRAIGAGDRFVRVETAVRAVARPCADQGVRPLVCCVAADGSLELLTTGRVDLPAPWERAGDRWRFGAATPVELLTEAAEGIGVPCPALVQLGTDELGRDVFVDLEAIEAIEIGGAGADADAIVAAVAATLAGSTLAEVTTLVGVGVPDDAFLDHRLYTPVRDVRHAFEAAAEAIGSTASMPASTFELRTRGSAAETWEPAVVLAGSAVGTVVAPTERTGVAVVSASPIQGPSSRLAPDGQQWVLLPAGIRLTPVGLTPDDIGAIAELVTVLEPEAESGAESAAGSRARPEFDVDSFRGDQTILTQADHDDSSFSSERGGDPAASPDSDSPDAPGPIADLRTGTPEDTIGAPPVVEPPPPHDLMVRLLGPVEVVDGDGRQVAFERSKTRELVAWLATHRERSTRSAARTALWELDVRDATFANVVSEARRSLARLTEPPAGDEWVGRTMTDDLPLHPLVVTDADLVRHALDSARLQPPAQAIATLQPAVGLIVGVPFEGTSYLWPDSEGITSNLVLLATTASTELAAYCLSLGDIEGVFGATGRGLQVLPGHEELIGLRMEAHARAGDLAGIRQEWESYERVINADPWSDGEPAPKLVDLRRQLLKPSG